MKWNRKKGLALAALLMAFSLAAGIPSEAAENYQIGIGKDQTVKADQTVTLDVTVAAPGGTFNTADLTFSYEKDYLTFDQKASTGLDGYTVQEENGKLRILKYGEKQQDGKVLQLAFHTEKAGTTKITIDSAKMDTESQAITRDAPEAEKAPSQATLTIEAKAEPGKDEPGKTDPGKNEPTKNNSSGKKKHHHSSSSTDETTSAGTETAAAAASTPQNLQSAKTGDQGPMIWIVLVAVAMIGCIWVLTRKRRKHE